MSHRKNQTPAPSAPTGAARHRPANRDAGSKQAQQPNIEEQAIIARAKRIHACELEVFAAIEPILARHRCRLGTVQQIIDGQPGPVRVVVMAND